LPAISSSDQTSCGYPFTEEFIQGYQLVPLINQMLDMLNVLTPYCSAFSTNCSLNVLLQVFFFSFNLAYHSK
jgi:hypothetical protein